MIMMQCNEAISGLNGQCMDMNTHVDALLLNAEVFIEIHCLCAFQSCIEQSRQRPRVDPNKKSSQLITLFTKHKLSHAANKFNCGVKNTARELSVFSTQLEILNAPYICTHERAHKHDSARYSHIHHNETNYN